MIYSINSVRVDLRELNTGVYLLQAQTARHLAALRARSLKVVHPYPGYLRGTSP